MITLETAESALKDVYLGVINNTLNFRSNPLLAKIKQTTNDVWGKEIVKLAPYGVNGGIGVGTETGNLPDASGNNYVQLRSTLKNLYGSIEISDKAIRASQNSAGAFVNLLNAEMEGLITSSIFNLSRMLYGDGTGKICYATSASGKVITCSSVKHLMEGMIVEFITTAGTGVVANSRRKIVSIDRDLNKITLDATLPTAVSYPSAICVQNSFNNELTGLNSIISSSAKIYGLTRSDYGWLNPCIKELNGAISDMHIQSMLDKLEERTGNPIDFIVCSSDVKRYYQNYLSTFRRNIDYMDLQGGYKAMSYAGIPVVTERFTNDQEMYFLNTKDFTLHQLCDWQWLEGEDGRIIKQKQGFPIYYATLVKYADLMCDRPHGQGKMKKILEEDPAPVTQDAENGGV